MRIHFFKKCRNSLFHMQYASFFIFLSASSISSMFISTYKLFSLFIAVFIQKKKEKKCKSMEKGEEYEALKEEIIIF